MKEVLVYPVHTYLVQGGYVRLADGTNQGQSACPHFYAVLPSVQGEPAITKALYSVLSWMTSSVRRRGRNFSPIYTDALIEG